MNSHPDDFQTADQKMQIEASVELITSAKIFQIDDEPIVIKMHEAILENAGFSNVYSFTDSVEAIETLRYVTPGVILTDIDMPDVSGDFLIKLIKTFQHLREVPIITVTSNTEAESNEMILRKGAEAIVHKPVSAETLLQQVCTALKKSLISQSKLPMASTEKEKLVEDKKEAVKTAEAELWKLLREEDRDEQKKSDAQSKESELWKMMR